MDKVIVIAEAGVNHNGDISLARQLVDVAADSGVDYVKFQTFKSELIASKSAGKAEYQKSSTGSDGNQLQMLKKLELSKDDHIALIEYCREKGVQFLSTPFDLGSIDLLKSLGITLGKIPSGEITNLPYLEKMAASFPELVMSTGMADEAEIKDAISVLEKSGMSRNRLTILHCNTEYPTPFDDVNLKAMASIADAFHVRVGYSDHTQGIEVPVAAVALGAVLIEKHFTLDRNMEGPDHKASLEPSELKAMVKAIRNIELALGNAVKQPSPSEGKNKAIARKSIVAARDLPSGHIIRGEDLVAKRPGNGISPMEWYNIIGKQLKSDVKEDELFKYEHFK